MPTVEHILTELDELTLTLRLHAGEADRLVRLPEPVVRGLVELNLFRLWIPRRFGGLELGLVDALRIYEAAAAADGAVGWAVMIGAGGGLFAAYLDPAAAMEIFAPNDAVIAGSGAPDGRAEEVVGGYRVSGRWRYASALIMRPRSRLTACSPAKAFPSPVLTADRWFAQWLSSAVRSR